MITESQLQNRIAIGKRIAEIRKKRGLTQEQLSELTGFQRANIGKIETGRYGVGIDVLHKICEALNVEISLIDKAAE